VRLLSGLIRALHGRLGLGLCFFSQVLVGPLCQQRSRDIAPFDMRLAGIHADIGIEQPAFELLAPKFQQLGPFILGEQIRRVQLRS
jgi:hypothetical protein